MLGSFLNSSLIESFQEDVCGAGVSPPLTIFGVAVGWIVSVDVVVVYTGTVSCVICSFDIVIFLFHYHFAALIL